MRSKGPRNLSLIKELIKPVLTTEENNQFNLVPSEMEIKEIVFQLGPLKALGPDAYPAKFYQYMWETVGADIVNIVQDFLKYNVSLKAINRTFISLMPKKNQTHSVNDYQ